VLEYLKDKDENEVKQYITKFKLKKFSLGDVIDSSRANQSREEVEFKIDYIIDGEKNKSESDTGKNKPEDIKETNDKEESSKSEN
jgi:hypothetical protein